MNTTGRDSMRFRPKFFMLPSSNNTSYVVICKDFRKLHKPFFFGLSIVRCRLSQEADTICGPHKSVRRGAPMTGHCGAKLFVRTCRRAYFMMKLLIFLAGNFFLFLPLISCFSNFFACSLPCFGGIMFVHVEVNDKEARLRFLRLVLCPGSVVI